MGEGPASSFAVRIPARQSFRTPASRPLGTPISRLASCLTFVPWSSLRRKCSSRRLATVVGVSPLQVPHPSLVRVGLSFDSASASAFAFRRHPEERSDEVRFSIARPSRDESLFVRQFEQHNRNPPSPLGGRSVSSECDLFDFSAGAGPVAGKAGSLAAAFAFRCHPEPIRAERGWVRDLLLLFLSDIPARQVFRTPARRSPGTPISRLASCLTFAPWSFLRRKCSIRRVATVVDVPPSPLRVPHPSLARVVLSVDFSYAFTLRCHPEERSDEGSLFVRQFEQYRRNPPNLLGGRSFSSDIKPRRAAPTARGAFPASPLSAEQRFSQSPKASFNSGITLGPSTAALESLWPCRCLVRARIYPCRKRLRAGAQRLPLAVPFPRAFCPRFSVISGAKSATLSPYQP